MDEAVLEITNRCPLNCMHCSTESNILRDTELSFHKIDLIITQLIEQGLKTVVLSGGEPTCHTEFLRIVDYLKHKNLEIKVYSCGNSSVHGSLSYLSSRLLIDTKNIAQSKLKLIFSVHSTNPHEHDTITNTRNSFTNLNKSIDISTQLGISVEFHFVPTKVNYKQLRSICNMGRQKHIRKISVLRFVPQGRGNNNQSKLLLSQKEMPELVHDIDALRREYGNDFVRTGSPFSCIIENNNILCNAGKTKIVVDCFGNAYPCEGFKKANLPAENISDKSLHDIVKDGYLFQRMNDDNAITYKCKECLSKELCVGGCPAQAFLHSNGETFSGDPLCFIQ